VCAHRSNCLRAEFVTRRHAIPITTVARTVVDLSAVLSPWDVERVIDDALRRRMATVRQVLTCFDALATRGRRRVAWLRPLLEQRQPGYDPADSDLELRIVRWLQRARMPEPVRQHRVQAGGRRYRLDLAYPVERLAIEVDGWDHHRTRSAFDYDRCRGNDLELAGWRIVRFTSRSSEDDVVATVRRALSPRLSVNNVPYVAQDRPKVGEKA
jgi:very-short-patch-repair endonuclease